jgi:hypothetical protein
LIQEGYRPNETAHLKVEAVNIKVVFSMNGDSHEMKIT